MSHPLGGRGRGSETQPVRGRGRGPFKEETDFTELRRPHNVPQVPGSPSPSATVPLSPLSPAVADSSTRRAAGDNVGKSRLSADAKEFFPKGYCSAPSSDSPRVFRYQPPASRGWNCAVSMGKGAYGGFSYQAEGGGHPAEGTTSSGLSRRLSDSYLTNTLHELNLNPGVYNSCLGPLTDMLLQGIDNVELHKDVIDTVIKKAIHFPNFRYTGVRLLCHFRKVLPPPAQQEFRNLVLRSCQDQSQDVMKNLKDGTSSNSSRGFALFLGELFMQWEVKIGEGGRVVVLGNALFDTLKELLQTGTTDNVKCVCQTLKLAGMALDEQNTLVMDEMFQKLQFLQTRFGSDNVAALIGTVIKLRPNAWRPPSFAPEGPPMTPAMPIMDPPFYLNNGDVLSPEECQFLQESAAPVDDFGFDSGSDVGAYGPPHPTCDEDIEEDEEFDAAYEEFLLYSNQKTT